MASDLLRAHMLESPRPLSAFGRKKAKPQPQSFDLSSSLCAAFSQSSGKCHCHPSAWITGGYLSKHGLALCLHRTAVLMRGTPLFVRAEGGDIAPSKDQQERSIQLYGKIERVFSESARRSQGTEGGAGRWEDVEGAWVLRPSQLRPTAVVHFIGGAFVGASPQLTYRLFLERLSERGLLIVATPFASSFDHLRIADEAQLKFDRCIRALRDPELDTLPVFGVGHSLGALTHVLIGSKYAVQRTANVLISFNNKEASAAIPLLSPSLLPFAQRFGPVVQQLTTNPAFKIGASFAFEQIRGLNPALLNDVLPLLEQLPPLYQDLADGKDQFVPSPEETTRMIRGYYGIRRNLLICFENDSIDESDGLAETLRSASNVGLLGEVSVKVLPGDHARPLQQVLPELPQGIADAVSQGGAFVASLAGGTPLADLAKNLGQSLGSSLDAQRLRQAARDDIDMLVDEVAGWMEAASAGRGVAAPSRWLPTR